MRILICLKQVPDTTEVKLTDDLTLEREFVAQVLNPADESALELGLELKEKHGGTVTVLTMGPKRAEGMLREALSRGADEAALMTSPRFAGADTLVTARCLAEAEKALGGFDLILWRPSGDRRRDRAGRPHGGGDAGSSLRGERHGRDESRPVVSRPFSWAKRGASNGKHRCLRS